MRRPVHSGREQCFLGGVLATRLFMSRSTVKAHLSHIYAKVGVANRTELATLASSELAAE
jgi:DNA-binding NarL/FixJ family response regulator